MNIVNQKYSALLTLSSAVSTLFNYLDVPTGRSFSMEIKRLTDLFWKVAPNWFFFSTVLGAFTGLCFAAVIPFAMYIISSGNFNFEELHFYGESLFDSPTSNVAFLFLGGCLSIVLLKYLSSLVSLYISQKAAFHQRMYLFKRIQSMPYAELEKFGHSRIINLLQIDVDAVTQAAMGYPTIWINGVTVAGVLGYLYFLDSRVFLFILGIVFLAMLVYRIPLAIGTNYLMQAREHSDTIQEGVKGLVFGAKELRLNTERAEQFFKYDLRKAELRARFSALKGFLFILMAEHFGELVTFLLMGLVIFHFPYVFEMQQGQLVAIVVALIFLSGPIGSIVGAIGAIRTGAVSLEKLRHFYELVNAHPYPDQETPVGEWQTFRAQNLGYKYSEDEDSFGIRGINAEFSKGQISYIIGGNGSGKSTFSKCVTLHYIPSEGAMMLGEQAVTPESLNAARQHISAIYTDYHVFKRLHNADTPEKKALIETYLDKLELRDKVNIQDSQFTTTSLSDGQRKRLALLVLLLEDREICIFDEWAADQDPRFKDIFYTQILPELKSRNKVVIVITHDDKYFPYADQIVVMESGQLKKTITSDRDKRAVNQIFAI